LASISAITSASRRRSTGTIGVAIITAAIIER